MIILKIRGQNHEQNNLVVLIFRLHRCENPLEKFKITKVEFGSAEHLAVEENFRKGYLTRDSKCRIDYIPIFLSYFGRDDEYAIRFFMDYLVEKFRTIAKAAYSRNQVEEQLNKIYKTFLQFLDLHYKVKNNLINLDDFVVDDLDLPFDLEKFKNKSLKENDYYENC